MLNAGFRDRAVHLRDADALVLADLHVGRAEASDVDYPLGEAADLDGRLRALLARYEPAEAVFAGDVLHRFSHASVASERSLAGLVDACRDAGVRPTLVRGNHDAVLAEVWDGGLRDAYELDLRVRGAPAVVRHGHEAPPDDEEAGLYVIGHDHPALSVEGRRRPCYLYAERAYRGADVLMLPAFSRLAAGAVVNRTTARDFGSPFVTDADALRPILAPESGPKDDGDGDDGALEFPPLGRFRRML